MQTDSRRGRVIFQEQNRIENFILFSAVLLFIQSLFMDIHNSFIDIHNSFMDIIIPKYPNMDILNYLIISINELWISKNEFRVSINEFRIFINIFKDILKYIFAYPKIMLN